MFVLLGVGVQALATVDLSIAAPFFLLQKVARSGFVVAREVARRFFIGRCISQSPNKTRALSVLMYHPAPTSVVVLPLQQRLELCYYTTAHDPGFRLLVLHAEPLLFHRRTAARTATAGTATTLEEGTLRYASATGGNSH